MNTNTEILLVCIVVVIIAISIFLAWRSRRTKTLRNQFGREYDRAIDTAGSRMKAEKELENRRKRVESMNIHALRPEERQKFLADWRTAQARFIDEPTRAVDEADRLVKEVMNARGYPVSDFEQRSADISVDHADVLENYRAARDISQRSRKGEANTEDLRRAMVHYRKLFENLLEIEQPRNSVAS